MAKAAGTARPRRNKAEVQQEFLKVRDEVAAAREVKNAKLEETAKLREVEVRQAVDALSVETVAHGISALSVQISRALAEVSESLIAEVQRLATVRDAAALERAELERLHKIDIASTTLDSLVQDYDSKQQALEAEMAAQRAAWDAEDKARERAEKEYDDNVKKQRQRETDEYEYKKTIERKVLRESSADVALVVGAGVTVFEALKAHDSLKAEGIAVRVVDLYCLQPLDADSLTRTAQAAGGRVITVEDHYPAGGVGDAVSAATSAAGIIVHRLAVPEIPRSGQPEELIDAYGISARAIVSAVKQIVAARV